MTVVFIFVICFDLQLSICGAALAGAQQIWQWFPFISFDIWFLLHRKWKATIQSLAQHEPSDPGWWTCLLSCTGPVVKIEVWFSQVYFVCVEDMSLSMYSFEFERREREFQDTLEGKWIKHAPALYAAQHLIASSHNVYVKVCVSAQMYADFSLPTPPPFHSPL